MNNHGGKIKSFININFVFNVDFTFMVIQSNLCIADTCGS